MAVRAPSREKEGNLVISREGEDRIPIGKPVVIGVPDEAGIEYHLALRTFIETWKPNGARAYRTHEGDGMVIQKFTEAGERAGVRHYHMVQYFGDFVSPRASRKR